MNRARPRRRSARLIDVNADLLRIARWLERQPWNLPGTDKTWVLTAAWAAYRFHREVERAQRVGGS